jgi:hypothetical protein
MRNFEVFSRSKISKTRKSFFQNPDFGTALGASCKTNRFRADSRSFPPLPVNDFWFPDRETRAFKRLFPQDRSFAEASWDYKFSRGKCRTTEP